MLPLRWCQYFRKLSVAKFLQILNAIFCFCMSIIMFLSSDIKLSYGLIIWLSLHGKIHNGFCQWLIGVRQWIFIRSECQYFFERKVFWIILAQMSLPDHTIDCFMNGSGWLKSTKFSFASFSKNWPSFESWPVVESSLTVVARRRSIWSFIYDLMWI